MGKDTDGNVGSFDVQDCLQNLRSESACAEDALTAALRLRICDADAAVSVLNYALLRWPKSTAVRHALSWVQTDILQHRARCALWGPSQRAQHLAEVGAAEASALWATSSDLVVQKSIALSHQPTLSWLNCLARDSSEHLTLQQLRRKGSRAARMIQRIWWRHNDRMIGAAIACQKVYRGHCVRNAVWRKKVREGLKAAPMQAALRAYLWRRLLKKMNFGCIQVQRLVRGHLGRKKALLARLERHRLLCEAMATRIQSFWRCRHAHYVYRRFLIAIVKLQAHVRRSISRRLWTMKVRAAVRMQVAARILLARRELRRKLRFSAGIQIARFMNMLWTRIKYKKRLRKLNLSANAIQRIYRSLSGRMRAGRDIKLRMENEITRYKRELQYVKRAEALAAAAVAPARRIWQLLSGEQVAENLPCIEDDNENNGTAMSERTSCSTRVHRARNVFADWRDEVHRLKKAELKIVQQRLRTAKPIKYWALQEFRRIDVRAVGWLDTEQIQNLLEELTGYVYTEEEKAALLRALDVDDHGRVFFDSFAECFEFELDETSKRSMVIQTKKSTIREQSFVSRAFAARATARYRSVCRYIFPLQGMWQATAAMRTRARIHAREKALQEFRNSEPFNAPAIVCKMCSEPFAFIGDLDDHLESGECARRRAFVAAYPCCFESESEEDERKEKGTIPEKERFVEEDKVKIGVKHVVGKHKRIHQQEETHKERVEDKQTGKAEMREGVDMEETMRQPFQSSQALHDRK